MFCFFSGKIRKVNIRKEESYMSKKIRTEAVDHLFDAILTLQNKEECYTFFEDVCTVNELSTVLLTMAMTDMIWCLRVQK